MVMENEGATIRHGDVVGIFAERERAEQAVSLLADAGFGADQIGFLTPADATEPPYFARTGKAIVGGGAVGAVAGAVLGALATVALPGAGLAVAAGGTLLAAAMGGVTGGATGGIAGLLFAPSLGGDHGLYYVQEVKRGRTLVSVTCPAANRAQVRQLLLDAGALEAAPLAPEG
jgi:hypothetical protein